MPTLIGSAAQDGDAGRSAVYHSCVLVVVHAVNPGCVIARVGVADATAAGGVTIAG